MNKLASDELLYGQGLAPTHPPAPLIDPDMLLVNIGTGVLHANRGFGFAYCGLRIAEHQQGAFLYGHEVDDPLTVCKKCIEAWNTTMSK